MIGGLDDRVGLQSKQLTDDGAGGATESWTEFAEVWAKVEPMSGREREQADREEAHSNYVVTIRNRSVSNLNRIRWRGRYLNVRFVRNAGPRPMYLKIEAEMGAAA